MLIETVSGKLVNVTNPNPDDISINDIAWAISRLPRFAGHSITETAYNVAQHSVYVAELLEEILTKSLHDELPYDVRYAAVNIVAIGNIKEVLLKALLHDAHEAYTGDIPSPVKRIPELRETIKLIEMKLDHAIRTKVDLPELTDSERLIIKYCDRLAQAIEGYQFMPSRGLNWDLPKPSIKRLQSFPSPKPALQSFEDFLLHFDYLYEA